MEPLCEQLARSLADDLVRGLWAPGDRLPSIRSLARTRRLSLNTVKEALVRLERRGLVEARPRSGYFATPGTGPLLPPPGVALDPKTAGVSELWLEVHRRAPEGAPFGLLAAAPDLLTPSGLGRLLGRQARTGAGLGLPDPRGEAPLRMQVARHLGDLGCPLDFRELFITAGAMDGVFLALTALTRAGDRILVEGPFFSSALQLWESLGLDLVELPVDPARGPDPGALARAVDQWKPMAVVLCPSFANPSGSLVPDDQRGLLVEVCRARGIALVEDDVFGDLAFDVPRPRPLKAWDTDGTVVYAGSLSKTSAPGWRVGWLEAGRWAHRIERLIRALGPRCPGPIQAAAAEHLSRGDYRRFLARARPLYARRRDALVKALARTWPAGTVPTIPAGGLSLWCRLPPGIDILEVSSRALTLGYVLMPGPVFTLGPGHRDALRLTFSTWDDSTHQAIREVGALVSRVRDWPIG